MTQDRRKYIVGTDLDTPITVRTSMARETALYLARVYKKTLYPKVMELTFEVDGIIVEVRAREKEKDKE